MNLFESLNTYKEARDTYPFDYKLTMKIDVESDGFEDLKVITHHIDQLVYVDEYPEIYYIYGVTITPINTSDGITQADVSMNLSLDQNANRDFLPRLTHHIEEFLDLDGWSQIISVYDVKIIPISIDNPVEDEQTLIDKGREADELLQKILNPYKQHYDKLKTILDDVLNNCFEYITINHMVKWNDMLSNPHFCEEWTKAIIENVKHEKDFEKPLSYYIDEWNDVVKNLNDYYEYINK